MKKHKNYANLDERDHKNINPEQNARIHSLNE